VGTESSGSERPKERDRPQRDSLPALQVRTHRQSSRDSAGRLSDGRRGLVHDKLQTNYLAGFDRHVVGFIAEPDPEHAIGARRQIKYRGTVRAG
jgi:hypothetical protein